MYLKRIELNGFKSFPSKKEIVINEGITGVVGPNGSGKSNIADAMRWVLGEQSSKNLRGTTMQDVIFNGTQSRAQKGYCEVALVFDNADGKVDTEYTEVCVRRKMYRSGESEYSINNAGCRLKDILELFRDTGIGKEGYSIIGQGRIDEILNSKPVQRRRVFEEAAGIMKYRVRKEEAERNLQKTRDNITRMDDIISELELQIGPLKEQMSEAKDYFALRDRQKELEVNLFLYNYDKSAERIERTEKQIAEQEQEYEDAGKQIEELGVRQSEAKRALACLQEEIEAQNLETGETMREMEQVKGEAALVEEREKNCRMAMCANEGATEEQQEAAKTGAQRLEKIAAQVEELNTLLDEQFAEIERAKESDKAMRGAADDRAESIDELKRRVENARAELQTVRLDLSESQIRLNLLEQGRDELARQLEAGQAEVEELDQAARQCRTVLEGLEQEAAGIRARANETAQAIRQASEDCNAAEQKTRALTRTLDEDASRLRLLVEMREDYEGYAGSVKKLLKAAADTPHISKKIKGVLAELMEVPREYETPMEVILGNALQNIVVETDEDAKEIISYLRKNDMGRVTFLPTKSLRVKKLRDDERKLLSISGVRGVASEMISCAQGVRPAVDFLLGRTVVVDDMDAAIALMRKADYGFRTVTMQGDFIKPGGVITGGSSRNTNTGLLSRKRQAEELEQLIAQNKEKLTILEREAEGAEQKRRGLQDKHLQLTEALKQCEILTAEARQKLSAAQSRFEEKQAAFEALEKRAAQSEEEKAALDEQSRLADEAIARMQDEYEKLAAELECAEREHADNIKETTEKRDALSALEIRHGETANQKAMLLAEAEHVRAAMKAAEETAAHAARQNADLATELESIAAKRAGLKERLDALARRLSEAGAAVREKMEQRERLSEEIGELEKQAEELNGKKNMLIEQKYRLIANKEKAELSRETMQTKIWDDYGLTYGGALELRSEEFGFQAATREVEEIKEKLRGMGEVNPRAIEDYAHVSERYEYLTVQREDLLKAGGDLEVVIAELLTGMRASFKDKFAEIADGFQRVFKELFGGGHAELLLEEGDIMECGIDIIAEPPGKKLQNISLLSGGEKALTAIALLFAMLDINPSPVCLLDEIDAPLDDANLIRLADYLTKLSKGLQFIVITHRKPTMAICDTLYGIAMHEKGVSDIVSVKLES